MMSRRQLQLVTADGTVGNRDGAELQLVTADGAVGDGAVGDKKKKTSCLQQLETSR